MVQNIIELLSIITLFFGLAMVVSTLLVKDTNKRDRIIVNLLFLPVVIQSILTIIYR